ncbi:MAG: TIGR02710 family CRISPR-associated protein [Planctomycetes bacterium]|nr:TIGR02710 family CRISPR-associated protein [Planctomycetota bacterium]
MSAIQSARALLLTVGTGDIEKPEETLLAPLRKSMSQGHWGRIVLLPSKITSAMAHNLKVALPDLPIEVQPLPEAGQENDADACFGHFDGVLSALRAEGFTESSLLVDFTRGTKAMSAALVLAAVRHDVPRLRYITGERDVRGMVKPGTETISDIRTTVATGQKRFDMALQFFRRGNFAGILEILPPPQGPFADLWPHELRNLSALLRPIADFYSAWDRLDYKTAKAIQSFPSPDALPVPWRHFHPTRDMLDWVSTLSDPLPPESSKKASRLSLLCADLLANGERRVRDGQHEDAFIRAYRVLELVGQAHLFQRGLDSASLPPDHDALQKLKKKLENKRSASFGRNPDGTLTAAREQVARLLKDMGDPLGQRLIEMAGSGTIMISARNHSVLIHGFEATGPKDKESLKNLYGKLNDLLLDDGGEEARRRLAIARSLDFSTL